MDFWQPYTYQIMPCCQPIYDVKKSGCLSAILPKTIPLHTVEHFLSAIYNHHAEAKTECQKKNTLRDIAVIELLSPTYLKWFPWYFRLLFLYGTVPNQSGRLLRSFHPAVSGICQTSRQNPLLHTFTGNNASHCRYIFARNGILPPLYSCISIDK